MITIAKQFSKITSQFLISQRMSSLHNPLKYCFACNSSHIQLKPSPYLFSQTPSMKEPSPSSSRKRDSGLNSIRLLPIFKQIRLLLRSRAPLPVWLLSSMPSPERIWGLESHYLTLILTLPNPQGRQLPINQQPKLKLPRQQRNKKLLKLKKKLPNRLPSKLPKLINPNNRPSPHHLPLFLLRNEKRPVSLCQGWGRELRRDSNNLKIPMLCWLLSRRSICTRLKRHDRYFFDYL